VVCPEAKEAITTKKSNSMQNRNNQGKKFETG
jgi:hypothetical protein